MLRKIVYLVLSCILWIQPVVSAPQPLKVDDIPRVMDRFFGFHIENKQFSTTIVRRSMKIYIENFDPEKVYLLQAEVAPYLNMSEQTAKAVLGRLQERDYSDFYKLNALFQKSIARAKNLRGIAAQGIVRESIDLEAVISSNPSGQYASSEQELMLRQQTRIARFYAFHRNRTNLDSMERRARVCELFEKKLSRIEGNYLFLTASGSPMESGRVENLQTVRILKSFAKSLDTHTSFFSPEEAHEMRMSLEKQFEGVGVVLSEGVDGVMIAELIKGSPAEQSGKIRVNDLLVEIDGVPVSETSFEDVLEMLKKRDRGEIILGFKRLEAKNSSFFRVPLLKKAIVMKEERIQASYVETENGIIGKISLHSFYENSDGVSSERDIKDAIRSFREKGELVGLVLDLRENSGGFLSQAVKVAGLFLSNGVVVISKYGKGEMHFLRNIVAKSYYNGPLVVLTSKMSASASEIVAQALQDYGVALVVGDTRTFGKGSIQYQTVTDEKADVFFKVTVGRYYTPSGKSTQITGVAADIVVPSQYAPYNIGETFLEYPLPQDQVEPAFVDPLSDLDEKTRRLFQMRYLPFSQRVVSFWKKMLPELKANSAARVASNPKFQIFLKKQETIAARSNTLPVNTIDEHISTGKDDLQMDEAVNVVKDMIMMEAHAHRDLSETGSD